MSQLRFGRLFVNLKANLNRVCKIVSICFIEKVFYTPCRSKIVIFGSSNLKFRMIAI